MTLLVCLVSRLVVDTVFTRLNSSLCNSVENLSKRSCDRLSLLEIFSVDSDSLEAHPTDIIIAICSK